MNTKLLTLYKSKWADLCQAMQPIIDDDNLEIKPTCPLLIGVDEEEYKNADIRLMIFGQETNNWFELFNPDIEKVLSYYDEYFLSGDWETDTRRAFWQGLKPYINAIKAKYPNKKVAFVWNNIIKIGKLDEKGTPPDYIYNIEKTYFSVVKEEIKILKPNMILFFTGPNYDNKLVDNFGELKLNKISSLPEYELASLDLLDIPNVFRTYHPMGAKFFGKEYIDKCFTAIIDNTNFDDPTKFKLHSLNTLEEMLAKTIQEKETVIKNSDFEMAALLRNKEKIISDILQS